MISPRTISAFVSVLGLGLALATSSHAATPTAPAKTPPEQRIALVIGNAAYPGVPLRNPVNDAAAMAAALRDEGFEVILRENTTKTDLEKAIIDFGQKLSENAVGLVYYSGHGMQVDGRNYLIPVDADIPSEQAVPLAAVDAETVLEQMTVAHSRVNIVIFDACRNNPFERSFRAMSGAGLAHMNAPTGTLIAYSTAPGKVASDGAGDNGIYTKELLKAMREPGVPVEEVFKQVRTAVRHASQDEQTPWEESSLEGEFYFHPPVADANSSSLDELRKEAEAATLKAQIAEAQAQIAQAAAERLQAERVEADRDKPAPDAKPAPDPAPPANSKVAANTAPPAKPQHGKRHNEKQKEKPRDQVATLIQTVNETPLEHLRKAADSGDADAQTRLADMYLSGQEVTEDDDLAIRLYLAAAQQGYPPAEAKVGALYAAGNVVPREDSEAARWFSAAATHGVPAAQSKLGLMYRSGIGVSRDATEASRWLRAAAEQGEVAAQSALADMYRDGEGVERDAMEAAHWYQRAALQGDANAQYNLGAMYLAGSGGLNDDAEGVLWIAAAAAQNHPEAEGVLGNLYLSGRGVLQNESEAAEWLHKAADQGIPTAQNTLGELYRDGRGVPRNEVLAVDWFRRAAAQGNAAARNSLNQMMYAGDYRTAQNRVQYRSAAPSANNAASSYPGSANLPAWTFR